MFSINARATAILAAGFFATSLLLSIIARYGEKPADILDKVPATQQTDGNGILNQLGGKDPATAATPATPAAEIPAVPEANAPAVPEANAPAVPAVDAPAAPATDAPAVPATPAAPAAGGAQVPSSQ